ncbi:c-type cytochrome [Variovorax davisae]|uniref:c-type cytochrome n=1 Tax=Variovorax davisae TaxID=3053515 RepID=UPI004037689D
MTTIRILAALIGGLVLAGRSAAAPADQGLALARDNGCMACHGMVHKQVGPGFAQVAARYRDDPAAPARLAGRIRSGSVGTWGRVIMPRQSRVDEAQSKLLADWVLSQPAP